MLGGYRLIAAIYFLDTLPKGTLMKSYKITTVIEKDEHGYYAFCPELEGCCTQGRTIDEAMKNIREAVSLYLETL